MFIFLGLPTQDKSKIEIFKNDMKNIGNCSSVNISPEGIGFGNLDQMLSSIERLKKLELYCEQFLKRLEKTNNEMDSFNQKSQIKIDTPLGPKDLSSYIKKFEWDQSRFPKGQSINSILGIINERLDQYEKGIKISQQKLQEIKAEISSHSEKSILTAKLSLMEPEQIFMQLCQLYPEQKFQEYLVKDSQYLNTFLIIISPEDSQLMEENYYQFYSNQKLFKAMIFILQLHLIEFLMTFENSLRENLKLIQWNQIMLTLVVSLQQQRRRVYKNNQKTKTNNYKPQEKSVIKKLIQLTFIFNIKIRIWRQLYDIFIRIRVKQKIKNIQLNDLDIQ